MLKTLQEDQVEGGGAGGGGTSSSRGSSVSGPATVRRRKKRRKTGSSASDSSGHSSAEHTYNSTTTNGSEGPATAGSAQKYLRVSQDSARPRPKSATLTRERPAEMDAQQQLMQPRTPPLVGSYRPPPKYHRRVMSSNQAGFEDANSNANTPGPNTYRAPDGRVYTLPTVHHKARMENKRVTEGPVIPLDPRKDVLSDIEGTCLCFIFVYVLNLTCKFLI